MKKRRLKRLIIVGTVVVVFGLMPGLTQYFSFADNNPLANENSSTLKSGWNLVSGKWYYADNNGKKQVGWINENGSWYYLEPETGVMQTGWVYDNGNWYYLLPSGEMMSGCWASSGSNWYYFSLSGAAAVGWNLISGKWYYMDPETCLMCVGWVENNHQWYYMDSSGEMQTGWIQSNGKWYYLNSLGQMQTGWIQDNGSMYFLKNDGSMAAGEIITGNRFANDGRWIPTVSPDSEVTRENVIALLDRYDPDGAFLIRNSFADSLLNWFAGDRTIGESCCNGNLDVAVHEQCHSYNSSKEGVRYNSLTGRNIRAAELIYIGGGNSITVPLTDVFDSIVLAEVIPNSLQTSRFHTYIMTEDAILTARQWGVYGLLDEFAAYYWGMHADEAVEVFLEENNIQRPMQSDDYVAYAEFRYFILQYMIYAKNYYPIVFQDIINNGEFRKAFTFIDQSFCQLVENYRSRRNNLFLPVMEREYNALMDKMKEKEYVDMVALLKP